MPNIGNQFAKGNKGGGRKSAYVEHESGQLLKKAFFGDIDVVKLEAQLERKARKNLWDIWLLKSLKGNEVFLAKMFDKITNTLKISKSTDLEILP